MDPRVRQYMMQKYFNGEQPDVSGLDQNVADAQKQQEMAQFAGIAAGAADKVANAVNQPQVLHNRMQDLGKAPTVIEPQQQKTDLSGIQKMAQGNLESARAGRDADLQTLFEQRKAEMKAKVEADLNTQKQGNWQQEFEYKQERDKNSDKLEREKLDVSRDKINQPKSPNTDVTLKLSDKYNSDPTTKSTAEVRAQAARAEKLAATPNAVNDMGLVYSLMKSFDPGSTVREGEFAMAAKAGGFGDRIKSMVELAETGQMTPEKRAEVLNTIKAQAAAQEDRQAEVDTYYSNIASKYQADPELIVGSKRSTSKPASNSNMVTIIAPNGKPKKIPANQVDAALKAGGKRVD